VTLADGSTLSVIRVDAVRFRMWDDMIRTVTDVRYVPGVRRSLVLLSELNSRGYELLICGVSTDVLCGNIVVIRGTRRNDLFEITGILGES
jgi:hypothetical protein